MYNAVRVSFCSDRFNNNNQALNFDEGYLKIPPATYVKGDFTIAAWINYNQILVYTKILEISNNKKNIFTIYGSYNLSNCPGFSINRDYTQTDDNSNYCSQPLHAGRWYHIAFSLCDTTGRVYVNGVPKAEKNHLERPADKIRDNNFIGKDDFGSAYLNAKLDDIRIYNRCMTHYEIKHLANYNENSNLLMNSVDLFHRFKAYKLILNLIFIHLSKYNYF